jgi:hypothetical protein
MQTLLVVCFVAAVAMPAPLQIDDERGWGLPAGLFLEALAPDVPAEDQDPAEEAEQAPLAIEVEREWGALKTRLRLLAGLPEPFEEALPSGALVQVRYELRVRALRRYWWDRKVWSGTAKANVAFDPVTGRYRCELVLDDVIIASQETASADEARDWLTSPQQIRIILPGSKRTLHLHIRARAVFSTSTKWLIFPSAEGTDWVEVQLEAQS